MVKVKLQNEEDLNKFIKEWMQDVNYELEHGKKPKEYPCSICFVSHDVQGEKWDFEDYEFIYIEDIIL